MMLMSATWKAFIVDTRKCRALEINIRGITAMIAGIMNFMKIRCH